MKFLLLSDLHLMYENPVCRKDNIVETEISKLEYIADYAVRNKCIILQAGDFFDVPRSWRLLALIQDFLKEKTKDVKIYCVYGQHDNYMYSEVSKPSTILGVLASAGYINILNEKPIEVGDCVIYGSSFGQKIPEVIKRKRCNILVVHAPISDTKLWVGQIDFISAKDFLENYKQFDLILCGDIHRRFIFEYKNRIILNTGCILRIEASEYNMACEPCFAVFDTDTYNVEWVVIPHKPAEEVISRKHIEVAKENEKMLNEFVNSIKSKAVSGVSFIDNLHLYLKENKVEKEISEIIFNVMEAKDVRE